MFMNRWTDSGQHEMIKLCHSQRAKKKHMLSSTPHTQHDTNALLPDTHSVFPPPCTEPSELLHSSPCAHTHTKLFPQKKKRPTHKYRSKEIECEHTWPAALLLSLDTKTLYLCLSVGVIPLLTTGKHSWASARLSLTFHFLPLFPVLLCDISLSIYQDDIPM